MTKLLEDAIHRLRQLPEAMQDSAARVVISQLDEELEPFDHEAIGYGQHDFGGSDFNPAT